MKETKYASLVMTADEYADLLENGIPDESAIACARAFRKLRESHHMTQKEFLKVVGIPQANISRIENGEMFPNIKKLVQIANRTGTTLRVYFEEKPIHEENKEENHPPQPYEKNNFGR